MGQNMPRNTQQLDYMFLGINKSDFETVFETKKAVKKYVLKIDDLVV